MKKLFLLFLLASLSCKPKQSAHEPPVALPTPAESGAGGTGGASGAKEQPASAQQIATLAPSEMETYLDGAAEVRTRSALHDAAARTWMKQAPTARAAKTAEKTHQAFVEGISKQNKLETSCFQPWLDEQGRKRCADERKLWGIGPKGEVLVVR